jgi:hypothetical protein
MKMENLWSDHYIHSAICDFCHPKWQQELAVLHAHLINKHGQWIGGFSKNKSQEASKIQVDFKKSKAVPCLCIDFDQDTYICSKHLIELAKKLEKESEL